MSREACEDHDEECFYCKCPLALRHEHEHWPIPARHGGDVTVPVCLTCHDLVDRQNVESWPVSLWGREVGGFMQLMRDADRDGRLLLAKMLKVILDKMSGAPA